MNFDGQGTNRPSLSPGVTAYRWSEFECRKPSDKRKHGDPFPLPRLGDQVKADPPTRLLDSACGALNNLAMASFDKTTSSSSTPLTFVQLGMMDDLSRRVRAYGTRPDGLDDETALRDFGCNANLYMQEARNIVDLDADQIKILSRKLQPISARELAPPAIQVYLDRFTDLVERPPQELEQLREHEELVEPHWDPRLKHDRGTRFELYDRLFKAGLLTLRRRQKARMGLFAVGKKGNKIGNTQRLIVDCRQANALLRRPPTTRLATPASLAFLDYSEDTLIENGFEPGDLEPHTWGADTGDVGDCFYNFAVPKACSWFSTGDATTARELRCRGHHVNEIFNKDTESLETLDEDESIFICFRGMPMGWSWALWLSQEIVSHQCLVASGLDDNALVRNKHPPPSVEPGSAPVGVYVDNVHAFGGRHGDAGRRIESIKRHFDSLGIPFEVDKVDGQTHVESLGLCFEFSDRVRVRAKRERAWRLWAATRALLKRRRISGEVLRLWLGHVNFHFLLARPLLSALSACYKFAAAYLGHRFPIWNSVRSEMKNVLGLIFIVETDLSRPANTEVHVGDLSDRGFSLMTCEKPVKAVRRELRYLEKWRFIECDEPGFGNPCPGCPDVVEQEHDDQSFKGTAAETGSGAQTKYGRELSRRLDEPKSIDRVKMKKKFLAGPHRKHERTIMEAHRIPPISDTWRDSQQWDLVVAKAWKDPYEHINTKEARVVLMAIRRLCRTRRNIGTTSLILSDSMVSILALTKGRSASRPMNTICRRAAAYIVGANLGIHLRHIVSADNPADGPSRWFGEDLVKNNKTIGRHTPMGMHVDAISMEHGCENTSGQVVPPRHDPRPQPVGFLELFAGTGNLTYSVKQRGLRVHPHFEYANDKIYDLLNPKVQSFVLGMIAAGIVWWVHLGTPCTAWSRARHNIKNLKAARRKEAEAIATALFSVRVIRECLKRGVKFSLENPLSSRLWEFLPIQQLFSDKRMYLVTLDMCQYGEAFKKPTRILTNEKLFLQLGRVCQGGHTYSVLKGTVRVKIDGVWKYKNRTSLAGAYGKQLCTAWAEIAAQAAPTGAFGVLSWKQRYEFIATLSEAAGCDDSQSGAAKPGYRTKNGGSQTRDSCEASKAVQEAIRYWRTHPVVFGQYNKKQIEAEMRKLDRPKKISRSKELQED
eukprot:Skav215700  [mRNA]  locus=scaffold3538:124321:127815:+ [translate_table: standard]